MSTSKRKHPASTASAASSNISHTTSSSSQKQRTSSSSPSKSANAELGHFKLDQRIRSVLYDRLALPLVCAFHDTYQLNTRVDGLLGPECLERNETFANILQDAVVEWWEQEKKNETSLTARITEGIQTKIKEINKNNNKSYELTAVKEAVVGDGSKGKIDIMVTTTKTVNKIPPKQSTPYLVVEVGLKGVDWWMKFDQGVKYLDMMHQKSSSGPKFTENLLLAILTIDDDGTKDNFVMRLGVFLCIPQKTCRMCLLWKSQTTTLEGGSEAFGKLLDITKGFQTCRDNNTTENVKDIYKYYSSNCCRVGNRVSWFVSVCCVCLRT